MINADAETQPMKAIPKGRYFAVVKEVTEKKWPSHSAPSFHLSRFWKYPEEPKEIKAWMVRFWIPKWQQSIIHTMGFTELPPYNIDDIVQLSIDYKVYEGVMRPASSDINTME